MESIRIETLDPYICLANADDPQEKTYYFIFEFPFSINQLENISFQCNLENENNYYFGNELVDINGYQNATSGKYVFIRSEFLANFLRYSFGDARLRMIVPFPPTIFGKQKVHKLKISTQTALFDILKMLQKNFPDSFKCSGQVIYVKPQSLACCKTLIKKLKDLKLYDKY